jgi:subtilisin family serine protease
LWNLRKIKWSEARAQPGFVDADNVRVAVLDTGIDHDHEDLQGVVREYTYEYPSLPAVSGQKDIIGHGTHVAGTIAALINNSVGINGICQCQMHVWKIFDDQTTYLPSRRAFMYVVNPEMYLRALADCVDQDIDVLNLSIGGPGKPSDQEQVLFDILQANGTTIVAAMGNERLYGSPHSYPAKIHGVVAVGATKIDDSVANFSNRGSHIALSAPGVGIWSTLPSYPGQMGFEATVDGSDIREGKPIRRETDYAAWDGTSMATPHVTGAAALLIAKHGKMSGITVRQHLQASADSVPGMSGSSFDPDYGAGRLNLLRLLQ